MQTIVIALDAAPLGNDLRRPADYNTRLISEAVVVPPLREIPGQSCPSPAAASHVEPIDNGLRWRVHPDTQLRWSDGIALNARHVLAGIRKAIDSDHRVRRFLQPGDEAAQVTPAGAVEIRLRRPTGFLPRLLTLPRLAPFRPDTDAVLGAYFPVGRDDTGGYRLQQHRHVLDSGLPAELHFTVLNDSTASIAAYRAGEVDATPTTSFGTSETRQLRDDPDFVSQGIAIFASLEFGNRCPELRDSHELRTAMSQALDRSALSARTAGLLDPSAAPAATLLDASDHSLPVQAPPRRVPDTAIIRRMRNLLGNEPIELVYADFTPNGIVVKGVCEQLSEVFGLSFRPAPVSYSGYVSRASSGNHTLLYTLTVPDYHSPAALLAPWLTGGAYSRLTGFTDRTFDLLFLQAQEHAEPSAAATAWRQAEERLLQLTPRIPLLRVRAHYLARSPLRQLGLTGSGVFPIHLMSEDGTRDRQ